MRVLALALALAMLVVAAPGLAREGERRPSGLGTGQLAGIGFDQHLGDLVPLDTPFRDEAGKAVLLSNYFGERPVVLALIYNECPMLCNLVVQGLLGSLRVISADVGADFDVLVVSFDPKDTPDIARQKKDLAVRRYKRPTGERGFHFLTGEPASIARLTQAVGFRYEYDEKLGQFAHPSGITVLTKAGVISRYFFGSEYSPKDLSFALADASGGKVGSLATRLLMLCYRYDPVQGTYSATALGAVRAGGALTMFALAAFMVTSLVRERRRRRRVTEGLS